MNKNIKRLLSLLLSLIIAIGVVPTNVIALDENGNVISSENRLSEPEPEITEDPEIAFEDAIPGDVDPEVPELQVEDPFYDDPYLMNLGELISDPAAVETPDVAEPFDEEDIPAPGDPEDEEEISDANGFAEEIPLPDFPDEDNLENQYAGDVEINEDSLQLRLNSDRESYSVVGFLSAGSTMVIPETYKGYKVNRIAEYAFENNRNLENVTIPNSIEYIGTGAFSSAAPLAFLKEGNAKYLGNKTNPHLYLFSAENSDITTVGIDENTKLIAAYAFQNCRSLTEVSVPSTVTQIGFKAFSHCSRMVKITLPFIGETVSGSGNTHFGYIFGAQTVGGNISYVPETLREVTVLGGDRIAKGAMYGVDMITTLTLPYLGGSEDDNAHAYPCWVYGYDTYEGNQYLPESLEKLQVLHMDAVANKAFINCRMLKEIRSMSGVATIGEQGFSGCSALSEITLYGKIESIGSNAFSNCNALAKVDISDLSSWCGIAFRSAADNPLYYAHNLYLNGELVSELVIPDGVESISEYAFYSCNSIAGVTIPGSVKSIGESAFYGCNALSKVDIADLAVWCGIELKSAADNPLYYAHKLCHNGEIVTDLIIPDGVTSISKYAFYSCTGITSITVPDAVMSFGVSAFANCSGLNSIYLSDLSKWCSSTFSDSLSNPIRYAKSIYLNGVLVSELIIPAEVTQISDYAFVGCSAITRVQIADGTVSNIGQYAFSGCSALSNVNIGNGVESIGEYAFSDCTELAAIALPDSITAVSDYMFYQCNALRSVALSEHVLSIGRYAFSGCSQLTSIVIPDEVTSIGKDAFSYTGLTSIVIPDKVTSIEWNTFSFSDLSSVTIGSGVTSIEYFAFRGCRALTAIVVPDTVMTISDGAFSWCYSLEEMTLPFVGYSRESSSPFGCVFGRSSFPGGIETRQPGGSYYIPSTLKKVTITDSERIPESAFYNCTGLTDIILSDKVKEIGELAFYNTPMYNNSANWYNGVLYYDRYLIVANESISGSYEIRSGTEIIAEKAFYEFTGITNITFPESVAAISGYAFYGCTGLTGIALGSNLNRIGDYAFYGCSSMTGLSLGNCLNSIGAYAFGNCSGLTSVSVPDSVTSVGEAVFSGCTSLEEVSIPFVGDRRYTVDDTVHCPGFRYFFADPKKPVSFPASLRTITITDCGYLPEYAFYDCSGLTDITVVLSDGVKAIGYGAFRSWTGLSAVVIGNSVTDIGNSAFSSCSQLKSVTIGSKVTSIGDYAFSSCAQLTSVTVGNSVKTIGSYAFYSCSELTSISIGSGVTSLGSNAFSSCSKLTNVVLGNSLTNMGYSAFSGCVALTSITVPDSVVSIGSGAFWGCTSLAEITLPFVGDQRHSPEDTDLYPFGYLFGSNSYTGGTATSQSGMTYYIPAVLTKVTITDCDYIPDDAFYNCSKITEIILPDNVNIIGKNAFRACSGLLSIGIPVGITIIDNYAFSGCTGLTEVVIPDSVTSLGNSAFRDCSGLTSVTIGNGVTSIASCVFCGCIGLTDLVFPESVESIGDSAFSSCTGLSVVDFPNSLTSIGNHAFSDCTSLVSIIIPENVTSIGNYAFSSCIGSATLVVPDSVIQIGKYAFNGCSGFGGVIIGNGVTAIGDYAFYGCSGVTSLSIGGSVTSIGKYAFGDCVGLTSVTVPDSVVSMGVSVFYGCDALEEITLPFVGEQRSSPRYNQFGYIFASSGNTIPASLNKVTITDNGTIPSYAFYGLSGLTDVAFGDGVTYIGNSAFSYCTGLTSIVIPDSVRWISSSLFYGCTGLTDVTFGSSLTGIDDNAFYGCTGFTSIVIPDTVTSIGSDVFEGCTGLTSITLGSSVNTLGSRALYGCVNITSVVIPESVSTIYFNAFEGTGLTYAVFENTQGWVVNGNAIDPSDPVLAAQWLLQDLCVYKWTRRSTAANTGTNPLDSDSVISDNVSLSILDQQQETPYEDGKEDYKSLISMGEDASALNVSVQCKAMSSTCDEPEMCLDEEPVSNEESSDPVEESANAPDDTLVIVNNALPSIASSFDPAEASADIPADPDTNADVDAVSVLRMSKETSVSVDVTHQHILTATGIGYSEGLRYSLQPDRLSYYVTGIGSCKDKDIVIPDEYNSLPVTGIGASAFSNRTGITSVVIPDSVVSIGNSAFSNCSGMTSATIGNSVVSIGSSAFYGCKVLTSVEIPDSVTDIGQNAFNSCTGLTSITFGTCVVSIGYSAFSGCKGLTSIVIPDSVTSLGQNAFYNCSGLTSAVIPGSVTVIDFNTFYNCTKLTSVTLGKGITSIEYCAFYGCAKLLSIRIPEGVVSISSSAFASCTSLTYVTIPNSVELIGQCAFSGCTSIREITLPFIGYQRYMPSYGNQNDLSYTLNYIFDYYSAPSSLKKVTITDCEYLIFGAFYDNIGITSIILPNSLKIIDLNTFCGCTGLASIIIPENVTSIGSGAFSGCTNLASIVISDSVTSIGDRAFYACKNLTNLVLSENVMSVGGYAFYGCTRLTGSFNLNNVTQIGDYAFYNCSSVSEIRIGSGVMSIGNCTFYNCSGITGFVIPDSVNSIGDYAFSGCSGLTRITVSNSVTEIGFAAFSGCSSLTQITIPFIGNRRCLPTDTNQYPFGYIFGTSSYTGGRSATQHYIGSDSGSVTNTTYYIPSSLTKVTITDCVYIPYGAFYNCSGINDITLPNSVTRIGQYAFYYSGVYNRSASWRNNVLYIGRNLIVARSTLSGAYSIISGTKCVADGAFFDCTALTELTIVPTLAMIGSKAVSGCTNLALIIFLGEKNEWRFMERASDWADGLDTIPMQFSKGRGLLYELSDDNEFYVSEYDYEISQNDEVEIPDSFANKPVTRVLKEAFYQNADVKHISIPETVTWIGARAFSQCEKLTTLVLDANIESIGNGVCSGTPLQELTFSFDTKTVAGNDLSLGYLFGARSYYELSQVLSNTLYTVHILGDSSIPEYAFYNASSITRIDYNGSFERIGSYAFANCRALTEFVDCNMDKGANEFILPDSVRSVGKSILSGCASVKKIAIGSQLVSIEDLGYYALFGLNKSTSSLERYWVSPENKLFCSDDYGVLYRTLKINESKYIPVSVLDAPINAELSRYLIPSHIVEIKPYAFAYNNSLTSIDLSYIRSIGKCAFYECRSLRTVMLGEPERIDMLFWDVVEQETIKYSQYIGAGAFMGCTALQKANIDTPMIVGIGTQAFFDCSMLKRVLLGENIRHIGFRAFGSSYQRQSNLEDFFVAYNNPNFKSIDGVLYQVNDDESLTLMLVPACLVLLDYQHADDDESKPILSQSAKVEDGAYQYAVSFALPSEDVYGNEITVSAIESYAFQGNQNLKSITIAPNHPVSLGDYVFSGSAVRSVEIGANVKSLGIKRGEGEYTAFSDCLYLESIDVNEENRYYASVDGVLFDKTKTKLIKYPSAKKENLVYVVPDTVTSIASMAFKENHTLKTVIVQSYVSSIGLEAFYQCSDLAVIYFDGVYAPTSVLENAFTTYHSPETLIGYHPSKYENSTVDYGYGWQNYEGTYSLCEMDVTPDLGPSDSDGNDYYAIVLVDENGDRLTGTVMDGKTNFVVTLIDINGTEETVRTGVDKNGSGDGIAVFYNLYGAVGLGFSVIYDMPYKIRVSDINGAYYSFTSDEYYLDYDTCRSYVTLVRKGITVQFDLNGGTGNVPGFLTDMGETVDISSSVAERYGYTFVGWSTVVDGECEYKDTFSLKQYRPFVILYAVWKAEKNTISFEPGTLGKGIMADVEIYSGETITLPTCTFGITEIGYHFIGWSLSADGPVIALNNGQYTSTGDKTVILYARWHGDNNSLTFLPGLGKGTMEGITVVTGETCTLPYQTFTRKGYSFDCWVDKNNQTYADHGEYTSGSDKVQVLTAKWIANTQTLTFSSNDGTGRSFTKEFETDEQVCLTDSDILSSKTGLARRGHYQLGWAFSADGNMIGSDSFAMPGEPITVYAVWSEISDIFGLNCNETDINTQTLTLNKAEYGTTYSECTLVDEEKGYTEDNIILSGESPETVQISAIVYCVTEFFEHLVLEECYLSQNGTAVPGVVVDTELIEVNEESYIIYFTVPVVNLKPEIPLEIHSAMLYQGEIIRGSNFLRLNIIDFSMTEDDIHLDADDLSVDLSQGGGILAQLLGSLNFNFKLNDNLSMSISVDGDKVKVSLNAEYTKSKTTTKTKAKTNSGYNTNTVNSEPDDIRDYGIDYEQGYRDNVTGNHHGDTWRFAQFFTIDGIGSYKMNIWFARGTEELNYYFYRCSVYDVKTQKQQRLFYGIVKAKGGRAGCLQKAIVICKTYAAEAQKKKDASKGKIYLDKVRQGHDAYGKTGTGTSSGSGSGSASGTTTITNKSKFEATLYGDIVFQYQKGKIVPVTSDIKGELKYTFEHNQQFFIWIIPVNLNIKVEVGGKVEMTLKYDEWSSVSIDKAKMTLSADVTAKAGIGCSILSAGVTGSIGTVFVMHFAPQFGIEYWEVHGKLGLYATYVTLTWKKAWIIWYPVFEQKTDEVTLLSMKEYIIDNREKFSSTQETLETTQGLNSLTGSLFLADAYEAGKPEEYTEKAEIFSVGDTIYKIGFVNMCADVEIEGELYDQYNYLKAALFVWDRVGDHMEWRLLRVLDNNGYNDFAFDIYQNEDSFYVLLTQQQQKTDEISSADSYAYVSNLVVKCISLQDLLTDGSIEDIAEEDYNRRVRTVADSEYYKYLSTVAEVNGVLTAVWVENAENNMFGASKDNYMDSSGTIHVYTTDANSIWMSRYDANADAWSDPACIKSGLSSVVDLAITESGYLAYIVDENGNLADVEDRMLYTLNLKNGNTVLVTEGDAEYATSVSASGKGIIYSDTSDDTREMRYADLGKSGESLKLPDDAGSIPDEYKMITDADGTPVAILFVRNNTWQEIPEDAANDEIQDEVNEIAEEHKYDVSGAELYGVFFNGTSWSSPVAIRTDAVFAQKDRYIVSYSAVAVGNDLLIGVEYVDPNGKPLGIVTEYYRPTASCSLSDYKVSYAESAIYATIANTGAYPTGVYAEINKAQRVALTESLPGGESKEFAIDLENYHGDVSISFYDATTGAQIGETIEFSTDSSDLTLSAKQLLLGEKNTLLVTVKNNGTLTDSAKLILTIGEKTKEFDVDGEILPGSIKHVEIPLEGTLAVTENAIVSICVQSLTDNEKGDTAENNIINITAKAFSTKVNEDGSSYEPEIGVYSARYDKMDELRSNLIIPFECSENDGITSVSCEAGVLIKDIDYSVEDHTLTINTAYLDTLASGEYHLSLNYTSGYFRTVTLTVVRYYTVSWFNRFDSNYITTSVAEGEIPVSPDIRRNATDHYEYSLVGWDLDGDGDIDPMYPVNNDISYTAVWRETPKTYQITWSFDTDNGTVNVVESYLYDTLPEYKGTLYAPYGKTFESWDREIERVTGNTVYTAVYRDWIGDINGDGVVSIKDVTRLVNYLNDENTEVMTCALDVNGDGVVTIKDVTRLIEYLNDNSVKIYGRIEDNDEEDSFDMPDDDHIPFGWNSVVSG